MSLAYLLTGSNIGNRAKYLSIAAKGVSEKAGTITSMSPIYETAAWGNTQQQAYLNQAIAIDTLLSAESLMKAVLAIEKEMGRERTGTVWAPRIIDIDILLFDRLLIDSADLNIPHPRLPERRFALVPLHAIAPQAIYARTGHTIAQLLDLCADKLTVTPYDL